MHRGFLKSGHLPTLIAALLYFDVSFAVWVILGPLAIDISRDLGLSASQKGIMVAVPVLAGAILRLVLGMLADRWSAKRTGTIAQAIVIASLALASATVIRDFAGTILLGIALGVAGASFAVALPLASRWYPPRYQGTALGIAGAGNSGTVLASLAAPSLAARVGWQQVFGWTTLPLIAVWILFILIAKDAPVQPERRPLKEYFRLLTVSDSKRFMFFYSVTFGGFIGLASSLPIYFHDQFGFDGIKAGYYTAACVLAGSLARPIGGMIADRIGGGKTLLAVYLIVFLGLAIMGAASVKSTASLATLVMTMLALGAGNGAVFQMLPTRFRDEVGMITGLVGMTGGVGGFLLSAGLGYVKQWTGSYSSGFFFFSVIALAALVRLALTLSRWRSTWGASAGVRI